MKNRKFFVGTTGALCIIFCLFLPFYFGLQFLLPILMPEESSSEVSEDVLTPDECSPLEAWNLCRDALSASGSFTTQTEGFVDTQILLFNYRQLINNVRTVTSGNVFLQNMNTGTLLNVGLQQYFDGTKAYLRPCSLENANHVSWADAPVAVSMGAYYDAFGPVSDGLSPYSLNERTLITGFYLYENEGVYSFSFELSEEAALYYARSLRTLCQLDSDPVFKKIEISLDMDAQFRPIQVSYEEEYTITMDLIGETSCKANYTETFSFDQVAIPEKEFFDSFSSLKADSSIPKLSTGYNFLFSLFGNTNTYDATLTLSGEETPLTVSFDTNESSMYAVGDGFSLVYTQGQYYFDFAENKLFSRSEPFNQKIRSLMLPEAPSQRALGGGTSVGSLMDNVSVKTENGKMIVSSSTPGQAFRVVMDTASMVVEELSAELSVSGEPCTLHMKQSPTREEMPALTGYTDITDALDSLDILLELARQPNTYYHVALNGAQRLEANVMLTLENGISLYASSLDKSQPFELFLKEETVTVLFDELSVSGSFEEFQALLASFNTSKPVAFAAPSMEDFRFIISVSGNSIVLNFGNTTDQKLTLYGSYCVYEDGETTAHITKTGHGNEKAKEAPVTKHTVSAADLCAFLEGSVYPELLNAGTIYADLDVRIPEGRFAVDLVMTTSPDMILKIDTDLYGEPFSLYYKEEDLYFCHSVLNAFVSADKMDSVFGKLQGSSGESSGGAPTGGSSVGSQEASLKSISVESHQIKLVFDSYTLFLTKDSFRLVGKGTNIRSKDLRGEKDVISIDCPSKKDCIDLEDLAHKLSCLREQKRFAFTGTFTNDFVAVMLSRLDIELSESGEVSALAAEMVVSNTISQALKVYYDPSSVYLDVGGIKLFASVDKLLSQPDSSSGGTGTGGTAVADPFAALEGVESITYVDGTLTVITKDGTLSLTWTGDQLDVIRYHSGSNKLLLASCEQQKIIVPDKKEYTDVTELGGLLKAAWNTFDSGSFRFDGNLDFKIFSQTLENVSVNGAVSTKNGSLEAELNFEVPYVPGISSANIPLRYHNKGLKDCNITDHVLVYGGKIYMSKVICGTYGIAQPETYVITENKWISLEDFQKDPTAALKFLFNLEQDISVDDTQPPEPDEEQPEPVVSQTPFRDIRKEGDGYVLEISPNVLPNATDELVFRVYADEQYVKTLKAAAEISVFAIEANLRIEDHGNAVILPPDPTATDKYLPLQ